ncbi:MAG: diaminopimelate decarboxylase [Planctomycetota bacterium]
MHGRSDGAGAHEVFGYRGGELHCESVPLRELADRHGTPLYVYSEQAIRTRFERLRRAFGPSARICFSVKSNGNLSILRLLAELGSGFDIVSGGELERLIAAGVDPSSAVFAGVAKESWEIDRALAAGISWFNVESLQEIPLLSRAGASAGRHVPVALRLNPDIDAGTHGYLTTGLEATKFGLDMAEAGEAARTIARDEHLELRGYHVHLGSQIRTVDPYLSAFDRFERFLLEAPVRREGAVFYDLGGGFAIGEGEEPALDVEALADALLPRLDRLGLRPILEPGRYLVAEAGALLTRVLGRKERGGKRFVLIDAGMNDLIRPALYGAEHPIVPAALGESPREVVDVVGPICESGDFLARSRELPRAEPGDLLAVLAAGAYGASMASNYNSRRRPAEVLVRGSESRLIRRREDLERLWSDEVLP